ncbi:MAG: hypothetical protein EB072_03895 [Betaproteobacteria bacterium]|nr:hypothetical protein [Betaproteobacteria bacterium]
MKVDLAVNYIQRVGTAVDYAEAYKWSHLGVANGDERAERVCTYCEQNLRTEHLEEGRSRMRTFLEAAGKPEDLSQHESHV